MEGKIVMLNEMSSSGKLFMLVIKVLYAIMCTW